MAELKTKNLIVQIGETKYKMVGSKLEDICAELGISEERFVELLARDFFCPTLTAAPTSSTLTYTDSDGSVNHFQVGQPCRWADGSNYRMALCLDITTTSAAWYILPNSLSQLSDDTTHRLVTDAEKNTWNGKYTKPSTGIPKTDLASAVQTSLGKADTALQSHQDISGKISGDGNITNIAVVSVLPSSPNAKTMYVVLKS